jgi:hypothetical protein
MADNPPDWVEAAQIMPAVHRRRESALPAAIELPVEISFDRRTVVASVPHRAATRADREGQLTGAMSRSMITPSIQINTVPRLPGNRATYSVAPLSMVRNCAARFWRSSRTFNTLYCWASGCSTDHGMCAFSGCCFSLPSAWSLVADKAQTRMN